MYESLGTGTFGKVFLLPRDTVMKKTHYHSPDARHHLIQDYEYLKNINKCLGSNLLIRHPKALSITLLPDQNWAQHRKRLPKEDQQFSCYFEMQRVGPLPQNLVQKIIQLYCPEKLREMALNNSVNNTYIARLYLGKHEERSRDSLDPPRRFFSMKNFNITVPRALDLGIDIAKIASAMGQLLARLHWVALTDANDIEICLGTGSAPNFGLSQFQENQWRLIRIINSMNTMSIMHPHFSFRDCNSFANHTNHAVLQICQVITFQYEIQAAHDRDDSWCDTWNKETDLILETFEKGEELVVWVIDFDKARDIDPAQPNFEEIVKAHLMNDPYWPVAHDENPLFQLFAKAYKEECQFIQQTQSSASQAEENGNKFISLLKSETVKRGLGV